MADILEDRRAHFQSKFEDPKAYFKIQFGIKVLHFSDVHCEYWIEKYLQSWVGKKDGNQRGEPEPHQKGIPTLRNHLKQFLKAVS